MSFNLALLGSAGVATAAYFATGHNPIATVVSAGVAFPVIYSLTSSSTKTSGVYEDDNNSSKKKNKKAKKQNSEQSQQQPQQQKQQPKKEINNTSSKAVSAQAEEPKKKKTAAEKKKQKAAEAERIRIEEENRKQQEKEAAEAAEAAAAAAVGNKKNKKKKNKGENKTEVESTPASVNNNNNNKSQSSSSAPSSKSQSSSAATPAPVKQAEPVQPIASKPQQKSSEVGARQQREQAQRDLAEGWTTKTPSKSNSHKHDKQQQQQQQQEQASINNASKTQSQSNGKSSSSSEESKEPASSTREITVPVGQFPLLIGSKGVTLQALQAATGARIQMPERNSNSNTVTLTGPNESVNRCAAAIDSLVRLGYSSITDPGKVHDDLNVDPKHLGLIIGPGGKYLKAIQDKTQTRINIPAKTSANVGSTKNEKVIIIGAKENVKIARKALKDLITDGFSPLTHEGQVKVEIEFPADKISYLIGPKGHTIKSIQGNTQTKINTPKPGQPSIVTVVGSQSGVNQAAIEIRRLVNPDERKVKHSQSSVEDEDLEDDYDYDEAQQQSNGVDSSVWEQSNANQTEDALW